MVSGYSIMAFNTPQLSVCNLIRESQFLIYTVASHYLDKRSSRSLDISLYRFDQINSKVSLSVYPKPDCPQSFWSLSVSVLEISVCCKNSHEHGINLRIPKMLSKLGHKLSPFG